MLAKKKRSGTAFSIPAGLGCALLTSLAVTIAGAAVIAVLLNGQQLEEGSVGYGVMLILALASALGAIVAVWLVKRLRLQMCMLSGGIYYLSLLAMTALLFGGQYRGMGVSAIVILAACGSIAFLPAEKRKAGQRRKKAYR